MYTADYLLDKLNWLLLKHGKIQTKLIDTEPNFPTRKCFIRAFGSVENACKMIGYDEYHKHSFTIQDAQKVLDERNGHFDLLTFNGMRQKASVRCRECGAIDDIAPDSLLRNKTTNTFGCKNCNNKQCKSKEAIQIINDIPQRYSLKDLREKYQEKTNSGYVYEILNLVNYKRYIGSTKNPSQRWTEHLRAAFTEDNPSYNYPLQAALRKYGVNNFVFHVLYTDIPLHKLAEEERNAILNRNSLANHGWGYNQTIETNCALRDCVVKNLKRNKCALINQSNEIVSIFPSYHDASRSLFGHNNNASHVRQVCKGERRAVRGHIFRDLDDNDNIIEPINLKTS